jgi:hypothetical protein
LFDCWLLITFRLLPWFALLGNLCHHWLHFFLLSPLLFLLLFLNRRSMFLYVFNDPGGLRRGSFDFGNCIGYLMQAAGPFYLLREGSSD